MPENITYENPPDAIVTDGILANSILSNTDSVLGLQLFEAEEAFVPCTSCASCNVSFGSAGSGC